MSSQRKVKESGYIHEKLDNGAWRNIEKEQESSYDHRYGPTKRRFHLFYLLMLGPCTREDIFTHMKDYYKLNVADGVPGDFILQRASRMFQRDLQYIEKMGYTVERCQHVGSITYQIARTLIDL